MITCRKLYYWRETKMSTVGRMERIGFRLQLKVEAFARRHPSIAGTIGRGIPLVRSALGYLPVIGPVFHFAAGGLTPAQLEGLKNTLGPDQLVGVIYSL